MNVSRRAVWGTVTVFALMVLLTAWFLSTHDRQQFDTRGRPKPAALRNAWLATEMLLARFGYSVKTSPEAGALDHLPKGGTVILSSERQYHLTPSRTAALLAWVEDGGLLIADASGVSGKDPILQAFDVRLTVARAKDDAGDDAEDEDRRQQEHARPVRELRAGPACRERAHEELALCADVEEAGAERDRDREAREDQRDRDDQRLAHVVRRPERAQDERDIRLDRVVAADQHEDAADHERDEHADDRDRRSLRPLCGGLTHRRGRSRPRR